MGKVVINFKVDTEVKEEAKKIAHELGLPLSAIINAQLRELIRTRMMSISAEPRMTPYLENVLEQVEMDRRAGQHITHTRNLDEALSHLDRLEKHQ